MSLRSSETPPARTIALFGVLCFASCTTFVQSAWPEAIFAIIVFCLVILKAAARLRDGEPLIPAAPWALIFLAPLWCLYQLRAGFTVIAYLTSVRAVYWGSLACLFLLAWHTFQDEKSRHLFLRAFTAFSSGLAVLCILQLYTSHGRVLWHFPAGVPVVFGTFQYHSYWAEFVELALGVALWGASAGGRGFWAYILASGLLYGSVIGSASRGGALLCTIELLAFVMIGALRRKLPGSTAFLVSMIVVAAVVATSIIGWQKTWQRFQEANPYGMRHEYATAGLHMAEARPWTGYGLGTFRYVYPQYAVRDFPFYANRAHNDWAEFAAEGGLPFLLIVLVPFVYGCRFVGQHMWGIGLPFVLLHAFVDYPFARAGVAGWMFAFLAALLAAGGGVRKDRLPRTVNRLLAGACAAACAFGVWAAYRQALANQLYEAATMESLRRAMSIEPNDFRVPFLLARIDPVNGRQWLARSIAENPYDSMALIELSVWEEFSPDTSAAAERLLLQASSVDHTYGPRWALCNFYFRHNQPEKFWKWARASLDIPSETAGNKAAVFRLCWLFDPDAAKIASILPDDPLILRAYLNFLLASNRLESVAAISNRLMSSTAVTAGDADLVHMATHRLLDTAGIDAAVPVWRKMQAAGWAPLDAALPYNSRFAFPFSRSVFDWYAPEVAGVSFVQNESGVEFAFSGDEPERCGLLRQYVALGGGRYAAQCEFETRGMRSDGTGLRWHIFNGAGSEISVSPEMADAAQTPQQIRWMFAAPAGGLQPVRIDLHYERVPGTARIQGTLMLHSIRLNRTG